MYLDTGAASDPTSFYGQSRSSRIPCTRQAIKHYATIVGAGEAVAPAASLLQNTRGIKFINSQTFASPNTPSYAVLQVTSKDAIRIPKFELKEGSLHVSYQGTILIGNFSRSILVAPYREDYQAVFGHTGGVTLELLGYVLGEDRPSERPIPEYVPHTSESGKFCRDSEPPVAAHPSKEREGAFDIFQAASTRSSKLEVAVQNKLKPNPKSNVGEVAATIADNEDVDWARNTLVPDHAQVLAGIAADSSRSKECKSTHVDKASNTSEAANKPKQVTEHLSTGKEVTIQRKPIIAAPPTPVRELVLSKIASLACHVACTFRAMSVNRIDRAELISNRTGIQQAFVAVGAGLTIQEWGETLRRGLADAIVRYHPKEPLKTHSVNDTLAVALRSLQGVSKVTDLGLHLHVKCGCPQLKHGTKGCPASLSRYMLPLTDLGLDGNLLAQFDEACVASIGTFAVEALPRTQCTKCGKAFEPSGLSLPRAFPFVLESHLLADTPAAFDLLGHEVVFETHIPSKTYRVATLIVHSKVDQHYTTLEYADAGYAYAYDNLRGLKLVYRTAPSPAQDQKRSLCDILPGVVAASRRRCIGNHSCAASGNRQF